MSLLSVRDLRVGFDTRDGLVRALNGVTFELDKGLVLALLGESGSGKSVTLRAILGLHPPSHTRISGEVLLKDRDVNRLDEVERRAIRGRVASLVFQEPITALDPVYATLTKARRSTIVGVPPSAVPNFAKSLIVVARRGFSDAAR